MAAAGANHFKAAFQKQCKKGPGANGRNRAQTYTAMLI